MFFSVEVNGVLFTVKPKAGSARSMKASMAATEERVINIGPQH